MKDRKISRFLLIIIVFAAGFWMGFDVRSRRAAVERHEKIFAMDLGRLTSSAMTLELLTQNEVDAAIALHEKYVELYLDSIEPTLPDIPEGPFAMPGMVEELRELHEYLESTDHLDEAERLDKVLRKVERMNAAAS